MSEPIRYSAGTVTAYGAAVRGGYTGTYEEWCQDMANLGDNVAEVREKAAQAAQSASDAAGSASEAAGSASSAAGSAAASAGSAGSAAGSATAAEGSATAAAGSASAAAVSATEAGSAQTAAETAQAAAETAQGAAVAAKTATETARDTAISTLQTEGAAQRTAIQQKGQEVLESIPSDYTDLSDKVDNLKSAVGENQAMLATVEPTSTASKAYAVDDLLVYDGKLYKVTSQIASSATIIPGSNVEQTTVSDEIGSGGDEWILLLDVTLDEPAIIGHIRTDANGNSYVIDGTEIMIIIPAGVTITSGFILPSSDSSFRYVYSIAADSTAPETFYARYTMGENAIVPFSYCSLNSGVTSGTKGTVWVWNPARSNNLPKSWSDLSILDGVTVPAGTHVVVKGRKYKA